MQRDRGAPPARAPLSRAATGTSAGHAHRLRGGRQRAGRGVGAARQAPTRAHTLADREPGGGGPAAERRRAAGVVGAGDPRTLGFRERLLRRVGRAGRAVLHGVHPEPVRHLRGPVRRREPAAGLLEHRDAPPRRARRALGVDRLRAHLRGSSARMEAGALAGRHLLRHHRGALLRALLLARFLLHPASRHPRHVLPGLHRGQTD